jgi:putative phosphoribosyl transferase
MDTTTQRLTDTRARDGRALDEHEVMLTLDHGVRLGALVCDPPRPRGAVIIAEPSGISRLSRREHFVASSLARVGFLTLLVDLVTEEEDEVRRGTHGDVPLLAYRLLGARRWLEGLSEGAGLPLGYLGVGAGGAAALVATVIEPHKVQAVVSREGHPDAAGAALLMARAPTLFIVDDHDPEALASNRAAAAQSATRQLEVLHRQGPPDAEDDTLDRVAALSARWFTRWLLAPRAEPRPLTGAVTPGGASAPQPAWPTGEPVRGVQPSERGRGSLP